MAMLAEPRRRQRIGPNPRGKFFMEDEDNKGRALLQKLGWQSGDGLGRQNQGMSNPLVPKIQMDSKGLGYDVKNDPWVVHNEEFAQLLGTLEAVVPGQREESQDQDDSKQSKSKSKAKDESLLSEEEGDGTRKLEKKSKSSRFRIHYHKFIKNKDVSNFSNTDLSCIFGQPTDSLVSKTKKSKSLARTSNSDDKDVDPKPEDPFDEDGVKTINCGSMSDYFQAKMKEKGLKTKEEVKEVKVEETSTDDDGLKTVNRGSMMDYFKELMAKRRAKAQAEATTTNDTRSSWVGADYKKLEEDQNPEENEKDADDHETNNENDNVVDNDGVSNKAKHFSLNAGIEKGKVRELKRKVTEVLETITDPATNSEPISDDNTNETPKPKKSKKDKKKKKSKSVAEEDQDILENEQESETIQEISNEASLEELLEANKAYNFAKKEKRKKAKKRKHEALETEVRDEPEAETPCDPEDALLEEEPKAKKSKKSKKNKKSKHLIEDEREGTTEILNSPVEQEAPEPTKKKKKSKYLIESEDTIEVLNLPVEEEAPEPTKKKKKSSKSDDSNSTDENQEKTKKKKKKRQLEVVGNQDQDEENVATDASQQLDTIAGINSHVDTKQDDSIKSVHTPTPLRKNFKKNHKKLSGEEIKELCMTFPGANLHQIRGYAYY